MFNLNAYLQDKGFKPNKDMSTVKFTAYNIDWKGKETLTDNLIINNLRDTWRDKVNNISGSAKDLVISLHSAYDWKSAVIFMRNYQLIFDPWTSEEKTEHFESKDLEYKDELLNRIYKLQVFAIMTRNYFEGKLFGYHHLTEFSFENFVDNEDFRAVYKVAYNTELDKLINNPEAVNKAKDIYEYGLQGYQLGFPPLPQKKTTKRKRRMTSINKELERLEREEEEHEAMIEMEGGEDALAAYKKQKLEELKKWYEQHKDD